MQRGAAIDQWAIGCAALALGAMVYLTDRVAANGSLVPAIAPLAGMHVFGNFGQWLPSFVHPFAFGLFTASVLRPTPAFRNGACAVWCAINLVFEIGQHTALKSRWTLLMNATPADWAITRAVLRYLIRGTFDLRDVGAIVMGTLCAIFVLRWLGKSKRDATSWT